MNLDYWLPWRDYTQDDSEDSTYEDEVIERCEHDFETSREIIPDPDFLHATIEEGYIVVPQYERVEDFCKDCGAPGRGAWTRVARRLAFKPEFEIDPELSVSDAMVEPVEQPADYVVDEDEKVTKVEEEEGAGRVLVNQHEDVDFGVTD